MNIFSMTSRTILGGLMLLTLTSCTTFQADTTDRSGETFTFECPGEHAFTVTYADDASAAELALDGVTYHLERAKSASGIRYDQPDGPIVFWERGGTAFVETGEGSSIGDCVVQGTANG